MLGKGWRTKTPGHSPYSISFHDTVTEAQRGGLTFHHHFISKWQIRICI